MALPANLQVNANFQPEEAAHAAAELISSLDNLPGEVVFLLEEIREKDIRINQLIQRINTRHIGLTKTAKQLSTLPPSNANFTTPIPSGSALPTEHLSAKDQQALSKIQGEWIKVEILQDEKIKLSERMERIINRAKERAKFEWLKVGGKEIENDQNLDLTKGINGLGGLSGLGGLGELGHNDLVLPSTGLGTGSDGRPQKKRKPNTISLPSPSLSLSSSQAMPPPPAPIRPSLSSRSSLNHKPYNARHSSVTALNDPDADGEDIDLDAEGEEVDILNDNENGENVDDGTETEPDNTLYCICQQKSYGEMIGCDNDGCAYEWFHVKCVGISGTVPDTWYCPECVKKLGLSTSDGKTSGSNRKGRKK